MYHIESGKDDFYKLLKQFEKQSTVLVQPITPKCIGIIVGAQNGTLAISFECELIDDSPKHDNPAEMDYPFTGDYGQLTSPGREWFQASNGGASLVTKDGTVIVDPEASYIFSPPIFDAVCRWTEEFFGRPEAAFTPVWLMVDEIDAGIYRVWKFGELTVS